MVLRLMMNREGKVKMLRYIPPMIYVSLFIYFDTASAQRPYGYTRNRTFLTELTSALIYTKLVQNPREQVEYNCIDFPFGNETKVTKVQILRYYSHI